MPELGDPLSRPGPRERKLRIAIAIAAYAPASFYGGPSSVARSHVEMLEARGHEVVVFTSDVGSMRPLTRISADAKAGVVRVRTLAIGRQPKDLVPRGLRRAIALRGPFDVAMVHYAREPFAVLACRALRAVGIPYVVQTHGMLNRRGGRHRAFNWFVAARDLKRSQRVLVLQPHEQHMLAAQFGSPHFEVVPNAFGGVIPQTSAPSQRPALVLFAARFQQRKRPETFVEAAQAVHTRIPHAKFVMVGPPSDSWERTKEAARGCENFLDVRGEVESAELLRLMSQAKVFVLPSVDEPFPVSVLEAAAHGAVVVITSSNELRHYFAHMEAAVVTEPDASQVAIAIEMALNDNTLADRLSNSAKGIVGGRLGKQVVASRLESLLFQCAGGT